MFKVNRKFLHKASTKFADIFFHPEKKKIQAFLFCMVGATLLWFLNALNKERIEIIHYPVHFVYNHQNFIALKPFPKQIPLSVKGTGWQIMKKVLRIRVSPIRYEIKSPLKGLKYILGSSLKAHITEKIDGVKLEDILVDTIFFNLDQRINRTFRVGVDSASISLKEGYRIVDPIKIYPNKVALNGPQLVLNALPDPLPVEIQDRQISRNFSKNVPLVIRHKYASLIHQDSEKVFISFKPTLFLTKSTNLIINIVNFPKNKSYSLHRDHRITEITYSLPKEYIPKIRLSDFQIFADFRTFRVTDTTVALVLKQKPDLIRTEDITFRPRVKLDYGNK